MITSLKVNAGDLSIEMEGNEYDDVQEALEEALNNPDIRLLAGLPPIHSMRTPETERDGKRVEIVLDGKAIATMSIKAK